MCNLDILMVVHDREFEKVIQFNSIEDENDATLFTFEKANVLIDQIMQLHGTKHIKYFTSNDYDSL